MTTPITDLRELKAMLDIPNGDLSEDKKLLILIDQATSWIEELLNRKIFFKTRTEYYKGTGTQKMLLRSRPVFPNPPNPIYSPIQVTYDPNGYFGAASGSFNTSNGTATLLTYGVDYTLQIDEDDGSSRSGILIRIGDYWWKPFVRQAGLLTPFVGSDTGSYQVIYSAGYFVDSLPPILRQACNLLIAKMWYVFPLGLELGSESYEERSISTLAEKKDYMLGLVKPELITFRNWKF